MKTRSLAIALVVVGCKAPAPAVTGGHHIAGWDASGSFRPLLPTSVALGCQRYDRVRPDWLSMYRLDGETQPFLSGPKVQSGGDLVRLVAGNVGPPARRGTRPLTFWTAAADEAAKCSDPRIDITAYTDGGNDYPGDAPALRATILRLSRNPRVKRVTFIGVRRQVRADLLRDFAPLGDRLFVYGDHEITSTVHQALDRKGSIRP